MQIVYDVFENYSIKSFNWIISLETIDPCFRMLGGFLGQDQRQDVEL